jgi:Zn-dependent membrane protease YugP
MVSWPLIFFGLIMSTASPYGSLMFLIGVICFLVVIFFHLVTLPVEFNASNRALENLRTLRLVNEEDYIGSRTVLRAAAMTYVAALATAVASLLRVFVIAGDRRR